MSAQRLFLLDAYALIFRSYYAFIRSPRINSKGINTSALFGFTLSLLDIIEKEKPDYLAVVFDPPGGSFRHEEYPEYKAQRDETPEGIIWAVPEIKKLLEAMAIPTVEVPRYEADDVIGALAHRAEKEGYDVYMVTPDKDYAQLVTDRCRIYRPSTKGYELWGPQEVCTKFELNHTHQVIDYLGLVGDSADNIPGCKGIGPKTASELLRSYGSIEEIYNNIALLKTGTRSKLEEHKEITLLSRYLATICTDVPIDLPIASLVRKQPYTTLVQRLFEEYEFRSLAKRIDVLAHESSNGEPTLFDASDTSAPPLTEESIEPKSAEIDLFDLGMGQEEAPKKRLADISHHYTIVTTEEQRTALWKRLSTVQYFAFDTETDGLDAMSCSIVGASFAPAEGEAYFLPLPPDEATVREWLAPLRTLMQESTILKIAQNAKFDLKVLSRYGVNEVTSLFDTLLAHYLIAPERPHNLDSLAEQYLSYTPIAYEELASQKKFDLRQDVPLDLLADYASEDADVALRLYPILRDELQRLGMKTLFEEVEMPLLQVLQRMEERGVRLDTDRLLEVAKGLEEEMKKLEETIYTEAEQPFNISSPKQVGEILFEKMKISSRPRKTKGGGYATGEEILLQYASEHPIVQHILDYRGVKKLMSTYIEALPTLLYPDGKLHTSFNQAVAATGRLSSSNPNLQNIPIRSAVGQEIRSALVPDSDEYLFLSADYSQIELRLLAHLSEDEHLIDAFCRGEDIHRTTAARIYKVALEEVTPLQRSFAKTANFGIIYGISAFGLSQRLHIPPKEAQSLIDSYFASYPSIKAFIERCIEQARNKGYAETIMGRRRYLPDINSRTATVRSFAERNAVNAPIQGTAADLIKIAMVRIDKALRTKQMKSRMILQVHDELNFDAHRSEIEELTHLVHHEMTHAMEGLRVPLEVEIGVGANWLEAH